jgi:predicted nucleotidyltransferase
MSTETLKERYRHAVARLAERAESDATLIGLYVYGSAHRGDVWEHSDIDAVFVTSDERRPWETFALIEDGLFVAAEVCSRNHFRQIHERNLRGSSVHQIFSTGAFAYSGDAALEEYLDDATAVGARDLELLRLRTALSLAGYVHGITKAMAVREDAVTAFRWTIHALEEVASLVVLEHDAALCREIVSRAHALEPEFAKLWQRAIRAHEAPSDLLAIQQQLEERLQRDAATLFKPVLDYLREERTVRTATELQRAVGARIGSSDVAHGICMVCNFLADMGLIERTTVPVRLTRKGRVEFDEAAYFLGGEA